MKIRPSAVDTADARADDDVSEGANGCGADWTRSIDYFSIGRVGFKLERCIPTQQAETKRGDVSRCLEHVVVVVKSHRAAVQHTQLLIDPEAGWNTTKNLTKDSRDWRSQGKCR